MLTKEELKTFKKIVGFNLWQIERDYLQHIILLYLSREYAGEVIVLKGGTALQKAYGLNRFSLDLDFTAAIEPPERVFKGIAKDITLFGFPTSVHVERKRNSLNAKLTIQGPLFSGSKSSLSVIRLEISLREQPILQPNLKEIIPVYYDIQPYIVKVMRLKEILAEKIRAILMRSKARDLYDLWFLLKRGVNVDIDLVGRKLETAGIPLKREILIRKIHEIKSLWKHEIPMLVSNPPPYDKVIREIQPLLNKIQDK